MSDIRPSVTQGNTILRSDYNNIQTKIANILGTGSGQSGYGQTLASSQVAADAVIDDAHWDNLRTDLLKARQHQTGVDESANLTDVNVGQVIDDAVITPYETFATTVETNKFVIAANQQSTSAATTGTAGVWNGTLTGFVTFTFASANAARFFFNSGGIVQVRGIAGNGLFDGGGSRPKDVTWVAMTNGVGRRVTGAAFYGLTNNYVRLADISAAAGVYVENRYYIDVACNVADNSSGGATTVTFRHIFEDNDVGDKTGTGDAVDENVTGAAVVGETIRSINNVDVAAPTISAPNF
jgi:hypothetical protein